MSGRVFKVDIVRLTGDASVERRLDLVPRRFELTFQLLAVGAVVEIDSHGIGTLAVTRLASSRISSSIKSRLRS